MHASPEYIGRIRKQLYVLEDVKSLVGVAPRVYLGLQKECYTLQEGRCDKTGNEALAVPIGANSVIQLTVRM